MFGDRHTYLLDPATQTKHTMVKDGAGKIFISSSFDVPRPNQPFKNWVEFSAPESDVVTVVLPDLEPFEGVSLVAPTSLAPPPQ